jgi:hypothetical protein
MVSPQAKREAVTILMTERDFGVTRACGLISVSRSLYRYRSRRPLPKPSSANLSWSMDFVSDGLADGPRLRCLTIVDDCTRECVAIEVDTSITGVRVRADLQRLAETRGLPASITVDHGPVVRGSGARCLGVPEQCPVVLHPTRQAQRERLHLHIPGGGRIASPCAPRLGCVCHRDAWTIGITNSNRVSRAARR